MGHSAFDDMYRSFVYTHQGELDVESTKPLCACVVSPDRCKSSLSDQDIQLLGFYSWGEWRVGIGYMCAIVIHK